MPWGAWATARWATSSAPSRRDQQVAGLARAGKGGGDHHLRPAEGARRLDEAGIVGDAGEVAAGEEGQLEAVRGEDIGGRGELPDRFADLVGDVEPPAVADHGIAEHERGRSGFAQPADEADRRLDLGARCRNSRSGSLRPPPEQAIAPDPRSARGRPRPGCRGRGRDATGGARWGRRSPESPAAPGRTGSPARRRCRGRPGC